MRQTRVLAFMKPANFLSKKRAVRKGKLNPKLLEFGEGDKEQLAMEMESRSFSELLRSTTEEILIKSMMDNPIGNPVPSVEMLGFKNMKQPFRADSEELFNSWLINGEIPTSGITHRPRQASMRYSADDEIQTINFYMGKAWSPQPSDRSGSPELRGRYASMQNSQVTFVPEAPYNMPVHDADRFKQELASKSNFCNIPMGEVSNQLHTFLSPSNSSTSFSPPIPSVVNMLKGTLKRKKIDREVDEVTYDGMPSSQEAVCSISSIHDEGNQSTIFHLLSPVQVPTSLNLGTIDKSLELNIKGRATEANHRQIGTISQGTTQSEPSTATFVLSSGFEVFDGSAQSGPTYTNFGNSRKHVGEESSELESKTKVDKVDPTKKRRVERSRKMAEAKEKGLTPLLPSDMQAIVNRCENLEKEVRSLKLNLYFMNRKDSEQTKQIEDLQKHNKELAMEKGRLSGEVEKIISLGRFPADFRL